MTLDVRLKRLVENEGKKNRIHSVVAGVRTKDAVAVAAAGTSDSAGLVAMTPQTPYYLASITKMYTAVAVVKLVERGAIDLDASISNYLADDLIDGIHTIGNNDYSAKITVSQLLNQTSGLPDYFEDKPEGGVSLVDDLKLGRDRSLSIEDIAEIVRGLPPAFPPGAGNGQKADYSDTNYAMLGAIVEAVAASKLADVFAEMIFVPLELAHTYVFDHEKDQPTPAALYFKDQPIEIPLAMSSFAPDGGIVSTVEDSLRFVRAVFGGDLLTMDQLNMMTRRWNRIFFPLRYGSGLMLYKLPRWMSPFSAAPEMVGHSGSTGSFAFYSRDHDAYLAGTVNQMDQPQRPYRLMTKIAGLLG